MDGIGHVDPWWASFVCWVVVSLTIDEFVAARSFYSKRSELGRPLDVVSHNGNTKEAAGGGVAHFMV